MAKCVATQEVKYSYMSNLFIAVSPLYINARKGFIKVVQRQKYLLVLIIIQCEHAKLLILVN